MSVHALSWAKRQRTGKGATKLVLLLLADYAGADGRCWPHMTTLAVEAEVSERTVRRCIGALEELGLLTRERRRRLDGTLGGYVYRLAWREVEELEEGERTLGESSTGGDNPVDKPPDSLTGGPASPPDNVTGTTGQRDRSLPVVEPSREPAGARRHANRPTDREGPTLPPRDAEETLAMLDARVDHEWTAPPPELRSRWTHPPRQETDTDDHATR